ncbi:MAG: PEGA domain-containing protein [Patescibacteria group bacterium]
MRKIQRRLLFYGLAIIFLILTPFVLAYSFGYSFDSKTQSLIPTGGIFIKTNQTGIKVFLNDREEKETSFLGSGALLPTLATGVYNITIEKDGFRPWEEHISVKAGTVSEHRNIFLIPEKIPLTATSSFISHAISTALPSPDGTLIALISEQGGTLLIASLDTNIPIFQKTYGSLLPKNLQWLDGKTLAWASPQDPSQWKLLRVTSNGTSEINLSILGNTAKDRIIAVMLHPSSPGSVYTLTKKGNLYLHSFSNQAKTEKPIMQNIVSFEVAGQNIYFITDKGFLGSSDLSGNAVESIGRAGFFLNGNFSSFASPAGNPAFIDGLRGLFFYDTDERKISSLSGAAEKIVFDSLGEKGLVIEESAVSVVFLKKESEFPFREKLTKEKVFDRGKRIVDAAWYRDTYILVTTEDGLSGVELGSGATHPVQKLLDETGFISTDGKTITIVNPKGSHTIAIE